MTTPVTDYEDALMIQTAIANRMDCICTRDRDYRNASSAIEILTPKALLKKLS